MTLSRIEALLASAMQAEGAFMGQLIYLVTEAIGVGGWLYAGFSSTVVLGGTPTARGLGFRFIQSKTDPFPIPVGREGVFEAYCPPWYPSMDTRAGNTLRTRLRDQQVLEMDRFWIV